MFHAGVRDDRTPGGLTKARFKRIRMLSEFDIPTYESEQSQGQLEGDIQLLVNCDPYISPSFVTTEGIYVFVLIFSSRFLDR